MDSELLKLDFSLALAGQSCCRGAESEIPPGSLSRRSRVVKKS